MTQSPVTEDFKNELLKQSVECALQQEQAKQSRGWITRFTSCNEIEAYTEDLQQTVSAFQESLKPTEIKELRELENQCLGAFKEVVDANHGQLNKIGTQKPWTQKLGMVTNKFCETVLYYERVLDVLNSQAPQYTSAVWAAIKILLLYSVNNKRLKTQIPNQLRDIGKLLSQLEAISSLHPIKPIVDEVTKTYRDLVNFLREALKYYNESRFERLTKNLVRPWEVRFEELVTAIKEDIQKVLQVAQISQMFISKQILQTTSYIAKESGDTQRLVKDNIIISKQSLENDMLLLEGGKELARRMSVINAFLVTTTKSFSTLDIWKPEFKSRLLYDHMEHKKSLETSLFVSDAISQEMDQKKRTRDSFSFKAFPNLRLVEDAAEDRLQKCRIYRERQSFSYSNIQWNLSRNGEARRWLESKGSYLLWVEGHRDDAKLDWTTTLSVDISNLATRVIGITVLFHFCAEAKIRDANTPSLALQSFIIQLIYQHAENFSSNKCHHHALSLRRFEQAGDDFTKLWSIFAACLETSKAEYIYIIVDNIDALHSSSEARDDPQDMEPFLEFLDGLSKAERPLCKILVTSRTPGIFNAMFESDSIEEGGSVEHRSLLKVPQVDHRGTTRIRQSRHHRLSIVSHRHDIDETAFEKYLETGQKDLLLSDDDLISDHSSQNGDDLDCDFDGSEYDSTADLSDGEFLDYFRKTEVEETINTMNMSEPHKIRSFNIEELKDKDLADMIMAESPNSSDSELDFEKGEYDDEVALSSVEHAGPTKKEANVDEDSDLDAYLDNMAEGL